MQFQTSKPQLAKGGNNDDAGEHQTRHTLLSMYRSPPSEDITLDEFERLALERLRVLKGIEDLRLRGKKDEELVQKTKELTDKHLKGANNKETARMDQLSHYILRLSYCGKPELRKWILAQECELFKMRFLSLLELSADRSAFLKREELDYSPVPQSEMTTALSERLRQVLLATGSDKDDSTQLQGQQQVYKVPFTSVPDLVAQRKVYLQGGWAYVYQKDLASLVVQDFRAQLSKGLSAINRRWRDVFPDTDLRLRPLVEGLSQRYLGPDVSASSSQRRSDLTLATLPAVSARHFPLCMHNLMQVVRREHHLRHHGRQQLGLFLKAVGLPMEEAMMFWRTEFGPKVPSDKFEKEYAYNIRHNYGKEGKMADYSAHTCVSIIRMSGGADEHHGCPYRRMDEQTLRANLAALKCEAPRIDEAMQKKSGGHFQLACACAFEGIHRVPTDVGINHPAQYYIESRKVCDEREGGVSVVPAAAAGAGQAGEATPAATAAGQQGIKRELGAAAGRLPPQGSDAARTPPGKRAMPTHQ